MNLIIIISQINILKISPTESKTMIHANNFTHTSLIQIITRKQHKKLESYVGTGALQLGGNVGYD